MSKHTPETIRMMLEQQTIAMKKRKKNAPINKPIKDGANAVIDQQRKLCDMALRIGIDPESPQILKLWEEVKHAKGFEINKGRGGGKKNTPSDTWRQNMLNMSKVSAETHKRRRQGLPENQKVACESCGVNPSVLSNLKSEYEDLWDAMMNGREAEKGEQSAKKDGKRPDGQDRYWMDGKTVTDNNLKMFSDLDDRAKMNKK